MSALGHSRRATSPRGLASFVANHPINDLVPARLISNSDLAAEGLGDSERFAA